MTAVDQHPTVTATRDAFPAAPAAGKGGWPRGLRVVVGIVTTALLVGLVALAAAAVVVPRVIGAVPLTVVSGSMEPALSPGDLIVTRPVATEDISVGDVITFQPESGNPTLVTHRVVGLTLGVDGLTGFVTRGDANGVNDAPVRAEQVKGRVVYSIPFIGHVTSTSWGPRVVGVAAVGMVVYGLVTLVLPDRSAGRRGNTAPTTPDRTNREEAHHA